MEQTEVEKKKAEKDNFDELDSKVLTPLKNLYFNGDINNDTVELINVNLTLSPKASNMDLLRKYKYDYLKKENKWYLSQSLSIDGYMDDISIWKQCASKDDKHEVNSNYGYLVYSEKNFNQFKNAQGKLMENSGTREAMVIFTRPSIHYDATYNGKHDFICTNYYHFFIRKNKLEMILSQRSCDFCTGFPFDYAWACYVYYDMLIGLKEKYPNLEEGNIMYNIDSCHLYRRSFGLLIKSALLSGRKITKEQIEKDWPTYKDSEDYDSFKVNII